MDKFIKVQFCYLIGFLSHDSLSFDKVQHIYSNKIVSSTLVEILFQSLCVTISFDYLGIIMLLFRLHRFCRVLRRRQFSVTLGYNRCIPNRVYITPLDILKPFCTLFVSINIHHLVLCWCHKW